MNESTGFWLLSWLDSIWAMLVDSSFLFIIGLILAGMISLLLSREAVARFISSRGIGGVFKAALIGVPLPLCSCSVLPVATQLRKSGAGKGSVVSFLISTPESGVDSIMLTYSLTDPLLTVTRPIAAFVAAVTAGLMEVLRPSGNSAMAIPEAACDCSNGCGTTGDAKPRESMGRRILTGFRYAFGELLDDLAPYLFVGFVLAGLVGAILGADMITLPESVRSGWIGYLGAILIGLPMYVCATSSTPLAAVLLGAGFSPGAILVFLLVGPATNIASLVVVNRIIGLQATLRYLAAIVVVAVGFGLLLDRLYAWLEISAAYTAGTQTHSANLVGAISAVALSALIIFYAFRKLSRKFRSFGLKRA